MKFWFLKEKNNSLCQRIGVVAPIVETYIPQKFRQLEVTCKEYTSKSQKLELRSTKKRCESQKKNNQELTPKYWQKTKKRVNFVRLSIHSHVSVNPLPYKTTEQRGQGIPKLFLHHLIRLQVGMTQIYKSPTQLHSTVLQMQVIGKYGKLTGKGNAKQNS